MYGYKSRASRDTIAGPLGDSLKITITAPPIDGKANTHLIRYPAKQFGVSRSQVELLAGETGRDKRLRIHAPERLPEPANILRPSHEQRK